MATRLTKQSPLCQLAVRTHAEAEDAVYEILQEAFGSSPVSFREPDSECVELSVFVPWQQRPSPSQRSGLKARLTRLAECGVRTEPAQIRVRRLADRDWKESWKRHFKAKVIGGRLLLKPSWSRRKARPGQTVVVLDPGLSFGTGQHPTTSFCLEELVRARDARTSQSFLDVGTGSGVLAIAAVKLGYRSIEALDNDPDAVRVAKMNARRNRVMHRLTFHCADLSALPRKAKRQFNVVCANLLAPLLVAERKRLCQLVKPGGILVIAGILAREFAEVDAAFQSVAHSRIRAQKQGEWQSAAYRILH